MRKLFGWKAPSLGRHRLGNPAFPDLRHYVPNPQMFVHPHAVPRVAEWTPGPRGIFAA